MSNGSSFHELALADICAQGEEVAVSAAYRVGELFHAVLSVVASVASCYTALHYGPRLVYHRNMKILLLLELLFCNLHAIVQIAQTVVQFTDTFGASPCVHVYRASVCILFRAPLILATCVFVCVETALVVERWLATSQAEHYEATGKRRGPVLTIGVLVTATALTILITSNEDLDENQLACGEITKSASVAYETVMYVLLAFDIFNFAGFILIRRKNKQRLERSKYDLQLSAKYQMRENLAAIQLATPVAAAQSTCFALFILLQLGVQYFMARATETALHTAHLYTYIVTYYTVILSCICWWVLRRADTRKKKKREMAKGRCELKDQQTAKNTQAYFEQLNNQWGKR